MNNIKNINYYNSRIRTYYETVNVVAIKNLKLRYKNSMLGFLWTLINPLFMLSIFVFVFSQVISGVENYPLYVLSGLIFWNFFSSSSNQMLGKIVESGGILKSVNIPPVIFPLASLMSNFVNFLLTLIPFMVLMIYFGFRPGFITLLIIPVLILFVIFTFSFSLILSCFNVYFRDVEMFWTTITPALFYATPVVYEAPKGMGLFMTLNPFAHFMELIRDILYRSQFEKLQVYMWQDIPYRFFTTSLFTFVLLMISLLVYNKLRKGFISNF
jgi:ABC-type polysaccharide/polyol phosphate export permease